MGHISVITKALEIYLSLLKQFDRSTKQKLIAKLKASLQDKREEGNLEELFGAWEDTRDSDKFIRDIKDARVDNRQNEKL